MDPTDLLRATIAQVVRDLADLRVEHAALADPAVQSLDDEHDSEGATVGYERARVAALIERSERRLADLGAALVRAEEGAEVRCQRCGRPVEAARLDALPAATLCIVCAHAR